MPASAAGERYSLNDFLSPSLQLFEVMVRVDRRPWIIIDDSKTLFFEERF